jgi:signal transduction histidine kinase
VLQRRLVALRRRADRDAARVAVHAHERELMLRDMHDGLGRITTSISLLTEVARRDRAKDGPLDSISSLAHEGSEEIRIFMRGLDDGDRDWQSLESHLRQHARQLVEALGGRYELRMSVATNAVRPSPYLYVHLLRVFQEGLTNALKYAEEPNVDVTLDVTRDGMAMALRNDGVRGDNGASHGISLGAGLENMRGRVDELGGMLDLELDRAAATATLRLQIPLPLRYAGGYPDRHASAAPR